MKNFALLLFVGLSIASCSPKKPTPTETGIVFQDELEFTKALEQSKKEGKLLFLDCNGPGCGACKWIATEVFPKKEVGDYYNSTFINLSYDMLKPEGKKIVEKYNVRAFPTLLFINSDGEVIQKAVGTRDVKELLELGVTALDSTKSIKAIMTKLNAGDRSAETVKSYLMIDSYVDNCDSILNDYYKTIKPENLIAKENIDIFTRFDYNIESTMYQYVIKNRAQFEEKIGVTGFQQKLSSAFGGYMYKHKADTSKFELLKMIDNTTYLKIKAQNDFYSSFSLFMQDKKSNANWNNFITQSQKILQVEDKNPNILNQVSWAIWENYKTFNDTASLKLSLRWAKKANELEPNKSYITDTYGHILFDLGYYEEARKCAKNSVDQAIAENDTMNLKYYKENVVNYKKKI